jgi:hypothetical protein
MAISDKKNKPLLILFPAASRAGMPFWRVFLKKNMKNSA